MLKIKERIFEWLMFSKSKNDEKVIFEINYVNKDGMVENHLGRVNRNTKNAQGEYEFVEISLVEKSNFSKKNIYLSKDPEYYAGLAFIRNSDGQYISHGDSVESEATIIDSNAKIYVPSFISYFFKNTP